MVTFPQGKKVHCWTSGWKSWCWIASSYLLFLAVWVLSQLKWKSFVLNVEIASFYFSLNNGSRVLYFYNLSPLWNFVIIAFLLLLTQDRLLSSDAGFYFPRLIIWAECTKTKVSGKFPKHNSNFAHIFVTVNNHQSFYLNTMRVLYLLLPRVIFDISTSFNEEKCFRNLPVLEREFETLRGK